MLTEYTGAAMREAHYELMEDKRFFGDIPACDGCWADGSTLEECRENLRHALDAWVIVGLRFGHVLPVIAGIDLNNVAAPQKPEYAETR
jgi:predicted RNase H-like HicB family nuclease